MFYVPGPFDQLDLAELWFKVRLFIEFHKDGAAGSLATGETVEYGEIWAFSHGSQFIKKIFGGAVKADVDYRLLQG
jgi:hypothetical protein